MEIKKLSEKKTLGIIAIVFGGLGLLLSWIPIINNLAFILAIVSFIIAIIALVVNKKRSKTLAIIGTVISILTFAVVLMTQNAYGNAWNKAVNNSTEKSNDEKNKDVSSSSSTSSKVYNINDTVKYKNVEYKVNSVNTSDGDEYTKPDSGKQYVIVNVTITNKSNSKIDYNPLYFAIDENGNQPDSTVIGPSDVDTLDSGSLEPNATVTGNLIGEAASNSKIALVYNGISSSSDNAFKINLR